MPVEMVRVLDEDPELGRYLSGQALVLASSAAVAPLLCVDPTTLRRAAFRDHAGAVAYPPGGAQHGEQAPAQSPPAALLDARQRLMTALQYDEGAVLGRHGLREALDLRARRAQRAVGGRGFTLLRPRPPRRCRRIE